MKWYRFCNKISLLLQALGSAVLYFLVEAICRRSVTEAWNFMTQKPLVFAYNTAFIFTTMLIVYLFHKRVFWRILVCVFWIALAIINGIILMNRVTPFTGPDIRNFKDGLAIAKKYLPPYAVTLLLVILIAVVLLLLVILIRSPWFRPVRYRRNIPLVLAGVLLFCGLTRLAIDKRVLSDYFGNIAFAYEDYGYPYCLATTIANTGISQPHGYSEKEISRIQNTERNLPATKKNSYPNLVFVQLESFFDPELVKYLKISEDPIPTFRKLMEDHSSGYFKVPVVGAGTVNTEFEAITGMSLRYFGPGEYPYKSILTESTCESAPFILKKLGYKNHVIHNNEANFYGRRSVFPNLGFDTFISEEYMAKENIENPLGWVKDQILTEEIVRCLDSTQGPDYIYTISVQGHGDYPDEPVLDDPGITVSGSPTEEQDYKWEYYVNQIHEMDDFIKELTETLSDYPEDVVLVLYGDHLPTMGLSVEDLKNKYLFQTEYVIWDNMGLLKKDDNLSSYQIAAEVMDRVGIHDGNIFRYHQARRSTKNYQVDLQTLQYDLLYGKMYSYGGESPFRRSQMRMGLEDVTLDSLRVLPETDYSYYIRGTNFTPSSEIQLNGEWIDTVFVDPTTLIISGTELHDFDRLAVMQRSNSSTREALSKSYDRAFYALVVDNPWKLTESRVKKITKAAKEEERKEKSKATEAAATEEKEKPAAAAATEEKEKPAAADDTEEKNKPEAVVDTEEKNKPAAPAPEETDKATEKATDKTTDKTADKTTDKTTEKPASAGTTEKRSTSRRMSGDQE